MGRDLNTEDIVQLFQMISQFLILPHPPMDPPIGQLVHDGNSPMWTVPDDTGRTGKVSRRRTTNQRTHVLPL